MQNKKYFLFALTFLKFMMVMIMIKNIKFYPHFKKIKTNNILIKKCKDMLENVDFEQDFWSRTAEGLYKIGHDSIRLMKQLVFYDRSY